MKSPVFSEDESSDDSIDLGQSPLGSDYGGGEVNNKHGNPTSPLPPFWFTGRNKNKQLSSPKPTSKIANSPIYDNEARMLSFDAAVMSVSQELDRIKEDPQEDHFKEAMNNTPNHHNFHEIEEEEEMETSKWENGSSSKITSQAKESAIRRETEGEFRLLGRREGNRFQGSRRLFEVDEIEQDPGSKGRRVSFTLQGWRMVMVGGG
ncbi:hypothetical protein HanPSC8_Chr17g0793411 [Helianthus annuus]|nr:hypothetical protein HanPSC8_Chr17g0793411 [Helianthus annuus]